MPVAYSLDLRKRVMSLVQSGLTEMEVKKLLNISLSTIGRYKRRFRKNGTLQAKSLNTYNHPSKIVDLVEFENFVRRNRDLTLSEMGKEFGCSGVAVFHKLRKIGYTFKKNTGYIKSEMNNEGNNS